MKEFGNTMPGPEENSPKDTPSCFPVDDAVTRSTIGKINERIEESDKETVTRSSLNKIRKQNKPLFVKTFSDALDVRPEFEACAPDYLFGVATGYEVLEEQAHARGREIPKVSNETINAFVQDVTELVPADSDDIGIFWDEISKTTGEDSGFMLPLQEAAFQIEEPLSREGFLMGVYDVYSQVKKAEIAEDMNKKINLDTKDDKEN